MSDGTYASTVSVRVIYILCCGGTLFHHLHIIIIKYDLLCSRTQTVGRGRVVRTFSHDVSYVRMLGLG